MAASEIPTMMGENAVVMFPEGYGIPIKEEGSVWMNIEARTYKANVGDESFECLANIYYTKGK